MNARQLIAGASMVLFLASMANVVAGPGQESDDEEITVSYADLNIANEAGAKVLYRRLKSAAKEACGVESLHNHGSVTGMAVALECYEETLDELVAEIDSAPLQEIHAG